MELHDIKLVSRTHLRKTNTETNGWQWFWSTMTPSENETIGVGGEGYFNLSDAINGFLSQQGHPDWQRRNTDDVKVRPYPKGYRLEKIDDHHYVICKFVKNEQPTDK